MLWEGNWQRKPSPWIRIMPGHTILWVEPTSVDVWVGTSKSPKESLGKAIELMQKALALDDTLAEAHGLLGFVFSQTREHDKAVAEAEKAVALNPNSATAHYYAGKTLFFAGRAEESIPEYQDSAASEPYPAGCVLMEFRTILRLYGAIRRGNNMV